jgi:hypothetical protein
MIFGNAKPKFVYSAVEYMLDYSTLEGEFSVPQSQEQQSVLNGHRELVETGDYAEFTVLVHLHKYANPRAKFEELYTAYRKSVKFYPHRDGTALKDMNGDDALFIVTEMRPGYISNIVNYDILTIVFKSKDYVDLSDQVIYPPDPSTILMAQV